jgi:peroxiredoxin
MIDNISNLPQDLPAPEDDGAADHLLGMTLPSIVLKSTDDTLVDLARLEGYWVIYIYPMTGKPGVPLPDGWDKIPGARGCTPQSCSFRDHHAELKRLNAGVYGLSAQDSEYQREARDRLHLPLQLLCDSDLRLKEALELPAFSVNDMPLFKRLTLIVKDNRIVKVFYPVFPPDRNADDVLMWLQKTAQ